MTVPKLSPQTRADRRQRLLDAAWQRFASGGYRDTTVDGVCDQAGVSKGAFYGYFTSKQDLLLALLEEETRALIGVASELATLDIPTAERVRRFVRAMLAVVDDPARVQLRADLWSAVASDPAMREPCAATTERLRSVLRGWIAAGIDSGDLALEPRRANALASILLALADGLMLHRGLDPDGFRWVNIRSVMDSLIAGIDSARTA
jgi:AcrR family transcriptional regulator